ncbi:glycerophosphodiester phosphodiesterase [Jatrophihabitans sp.]|uniref:glycerophosphodiester phosphodiesterase n=1 Tax=Jatrophihabitans sp. TaxID=1932789 RepID=UPI002F085421
MTFDQHVSRRTLLGAFGGLGLLAACSGPADSPGKGARSTGGSPARRAAGSGPLTVASWAANRGTRFSIAHRGAGDIYPEHSLPSYRAAVEMGAQCLEVSVNMTSDGVLICMHDLSYDRTTTGKGFIADQPSSVLSRIAIRQPQLGPVWVQPPLPEIPRLETVLTEFGGKVVICLEAKDDRAYPSMMAMVTRLGLQDSVIVKAYYSSARIPQAKAAGLPVFSYLSPADMNEPTIATAAARLDRNDLLVLPADNGDYVTYYPDALIASALAHQVPLLVYPIHRRADAEHYFKLGVSGAVTSDYGYTTGTTAAATSDSWASKRISSGEKPKMPDSRSLAGAWTSVNELTLGAEGARQFLTLGQLCPIPAAASQYRLKFSVAWDRLPADPSATVTLAFCHLDDRYYEDGLSLSEGYHATMSPDGTLRLYRHSAAASDELLGQARTPPVRAGQWATLRLDVSPQSLIWRRADVGEGDQVVVHDSAVRGGYVAIGRSSSDLRAALALREFSVG